VADAHPGATSVAPARSLERDRFLDVVRSIAIVRVIAWHTWAAPVLSWLVASMPAMFFVTGSLLATSLDRAVGRGSGAGAVVRDRLHRLLLPLWTLAAAAHIAMALAWWSAAGPETRIPWWQLWTWLLPIVDPVDTGWAQTWLARPLWYLRVLLWLLAAAPLLRVLYRRFGVWCCAVPAVLTVVAEVATDDRWFAGHPLVRFHLTDVVTYVTFFLLGFWHHDGGTAAVHHHRRWLLCAAGVAATAAWALARPPAGGVVNNSPVLLLTVGWTWLWAFLALEPQLRSLGSGRRTSPLVSWLSRRSLTVYLWHTTAIVAVYAALDHVRVTAPLVRVALTTVGVTAGVGLLAALFGWIEDRAARREPHVWPGRSPVVRAPARTAGAVVMAGGLLVWVAVTLLPSESDGFVPPPPSGRPPELVLSADGETAHGVWQGVTPPLPVLDTEARAALSGFVHRYGDAGATASVLTADGTAWSGAVGRAGGPPPFAVEDLPLVGSITKSVTAVLANQLADEGLLDLDEPIVAVAGVPSWPAKAGITLRHLLLHRAGIVSYPEARGYDRSATYTPASAVELSVSEPLLHRPGAASGYSNSGYLAVGLLLEQVSGRPFAELAADRIFLPLGMSSASVDVTPHRGFIGHASGGMRATIDDLVRLAGAVYRDGALVQPRTYQAMVPTETSVGMGIGGFCPCAGDGWISVFGHDSGTFVARWYREGDVVVVLRVTDGFHTDPRRRAAVYGLAARLADIAAGRR
jgi:CubicO group peptidase (beta-lactamase class C family)/peptidoglycan/LPS O-acetylase OafA/YrhL